MKKQLGGLLILPLMLPLSACLSLGGKPPPYYITMVPTQPMQAKGDVRIAPETAVLIRFPALAPAIDTTRVPVYQPDARLTYLANAQWNDQPSKLFQRLLTEQVIGLGQRSVVDVRSDIRPASVLNGHLQMLGVDSATSEVVAVYDATIETDGQAHARRFEARIPVSKIDANTVGPALNQAVNQIATEVAQWITGR